MESCRPLALCALAAALLLGARGHEPPEPPEPPRRDRDLAPAAASHEKELIEALQEVLEKLKSKRIPHYEKKFGQVPMCDAGEQCAVRKGARIGKLCDCPRATSCNSFLLKCL
ncbi:cocaine- and amphetamine-regulated transcript protein [Nothoprocta perdicaria]|uniref:cocaine- and amphetamine-regulated transcript protein n=1 Tax=Nothoprocta perdicaria TaxID=30464 RepID=UPI000E1BDFDC|nr:cocaine- and amphetamine-regulated transcript protein [Nothoprocta perdicaria]